MSTNQKSSFKVDPRIAEILGESYRSSEQALKELVDNAWDADATRVEIQLPDPMTADPIIITDNGSGMTAPEVESEYLHIGRNRRTLRGERTKKLNRLVKGQKGIGKFAGLMVADQMVLSTVARGIRSSFQLRKSELLISNRDLEDYEIVIQTLTEDAVKTGTRIELRDLNQNLSFPNPDKMRAFLIREYGRESDIGIVINDQMIGVEDLPGPSFEQVIPLESGGSVKLKFTVADGKRNVRDAGIAIRAGGKVIGRPQMLGLNENELIPKNLIGKVYGEAELEGVDLDCVTADNGGFVENHVAFQEMTKKLASIVTKGLEDTRGAEMRAAKARYQKTINQKLEKLPEYKRQFANRALERVLQRFYFEDEEKFGSIISVVLDALEYEPYWLVIQKLDSAKIGEVEALAEALIEFGIADLSVVGRQAQYRNRVLDDFQRLIDNPKTVEADVHRVLEANLWLLDIDGKLISSNETLKTVIETYLDGKYKGDRAKKRPDLLIAHDMADSTTVIELKRPNHTIDRDDEAQAIKNPGARQSKVVRELHARHRLALTGTPIQNRKRDLLSLELHERTREHYYPIVRGTDRNRQKTCDVADSRTQTGRMMTAASALPQTVTIASLSSSLKDTNE